MPESRVVQTGVLSRPRMQALVLLAATGIGLYLCYRLVQPFFPALSWGLALAVVGYPVHRRIRRYVPYASVAAGLTVFVIAVTIIAPVVFVSQQLVRQLMSSVTFVKESLASGEWREALEQRPRLAGIVGWVEQVATLEDLPTRLIERMQEWGPTLVVGSLAAAMQLGITILVLFYFFRDKRDLADDVRSVLPLSERETSGMIRRITDTIHATIFGSLVVAAIQGVMGGLIFWMLGLPAPILWGAVMAVLATIPVAGTFVVWAPTALYLAMTGEWGKALVLVSWGALAIGLIDNVLYPVLVGKRLRFHPLPVFFSIVGGLSVFGAAGLVLGPLTLSVTTALLEVFRRRTSAGRAADTRAAADAAA